MSREHLIAEPHGQPIDPTAVVDQLHASLDVDMRKLAVSEIYDRYVNVAEVRRVRAERGCSLMDAKRACQRAAFTEIRRQPTVEGLDFIVGILLEEWR